MMAGSEKAIKYLIVVLFFTLSTFSLKAQTTVNYSVNTQVIRNPERGYTLFWGTNVSSFQPLTDLVLSKNKDSLSLIHRYYILNSYNLDGSTISAAFLNLIENDMSIARCNGYKIIPRFCYDFTAPPNPSQPWNDSPNKATVLNHIRQLKPVIQNNSDVILTLQNGFWGDFGENFYSDEFGCKCNGTDTPAKWADRKQVTDSLLAVLPSSRLLSVRYPTLKSTYYGYTIPTDSLTLAGAHTGITKSRIGYHNDCFLVAADDYTFGNTATEKPYWETEGKYTIMGGETCGDNGGAYTNCANTLKDMENAHWTYLNPPFDLAITNRWNSGGCYNDIRDRLGYRLHMTIGTYTNTVKPGGVFNYTIQLTNTGFAAPVNPRKVELVLKNKSDNRECKYPINVDPRFWFPGNTFTLTGSVGIPPSYLDGSYDVFLSLQDPESTLYGKPDYAIQLANTGVWNSILGYNDLGFDLVISSSAGGTSYGGTEWFGTCNTGFCPGTGSLSYEYWKNQNTWGNVSSVNWASNPDSTGILTAFKDPLNSKNWFGSRISGYICPPVTGNYTFYIYSGDPSQLWLSTNNSPTNKVKIAEVPSGGFTNLGEWNKYSSQKSVIIPLVAGTLYYIESLYKENNNGSYMAVGWSIPGSTCNIEIISGSNLAPNPLVLLPVVFIDVTVVKNPGLHSATLSWVTASELNNDYFVVQKSNDGYRFVDVGFVNGSGNSKTLLNYSWVDKDLQNGITYYRIKQVDFNDDYYFSSIVSLNDSGAGAITVYPNPVKDNLRVNLSSSGKDVIVHVYDVLGIEVYTNRCKDCDQHLLLDVGVLLPGIYILGIETDSRIVFEKMVKE